MEEPNIQDLTIAHREGYDAGLEFHMNGTPKPDNPYRDDHPSLEEAWENGFDQAGEDS